MLVLFFFNGNDRIERQYILQGGDKKQATNHTKY